MALFDDFFSSSRGPGAIATFLALFVLAAFTGLGFLVFDGRFNGDQASSMAEAVKSQEFRIEGLKRLISELEDELAQSEERAKIGDDVRRLQRSLADQKQFLAGLEADVADAQEKLSGTRQSWEDYKNDYRATARAQAVGLKIPELTTLDGEVYKNVTVRNVDNLSMRIFHESGPASIDWDQLPLDMQDRFQFDKQDAAKAAEEAETREKVWQELVRNQTTLKKVATLKTNIGLGREEIGRLQRDIRNNHGLMAANRNSIANYRQQAADARDRHAAALAAGRRSSHLATATRMDNSAASKERENRMIAKRNEKANARIREIEEEIRELEQQIGDLEASAKKE